MVSFFGFGHFTKVRIHRVHLLVDFESMFSPIEAFGRLDRPLLPHLDFFEGLVD